jgi:hypothetical protein
MLIDVLIQTLEFVPSVACSSFYTCWLWSLIIFLIQRSLFSVMFIPHEDFTPQKNVHSSTRGSVGGVTPLRVPGVKPPKEKLPCKCIL